MQFEERRRTAAPVNLTPLIDLVFLLLVFFMLTSSFVTEERLAVDLPEAAGGEPADARALEIVVDAQGRIRLQGRAIEAEALDAALREALSSREDRVVRIRGDRAVALGTAIGVLDAARSAGAEAVDIVTERR